MMFKEATPEAHLEAWRILWAAVGNLAVFPAEVSGSITDVPWQDVSLPTEFVFILTWMQLVWCGTTMQTAMLITSLILIVKVGSLTGIRLATPGGTTKRHLGGSVSAQEPLELL